MEAAVGFVSAVLGDRDYRRAWAFADENWRLCRAQAWLFNKRGLPWVADLDREAVADGLSCLDPTHELWVPFSACEMELFTTAWASVPLKNLAVATNRRRVEDGEIVLLVDRSSYPDQLIVWQPTPAMSLRFLVRNDGYGWLVSNHVGDRLPLPGWPPDWREGWSYAGSIRDG